MKKKTKETVNNTHTDNFRENGITLIALVVTIVILLILAGISINLVLGNNGVINKAKDAKERTARASLIERVKQDITVTQMDKIEAEAETDLSEDELREIFNKYFENDSIPEDITLDTDLIAKDEYGGSIIKVSDIYDGTITKSLKTPVLDKTLWQAACDSTIIHIKPANKEEYETELASSSEINVISTAKENTYKVYAWTSDVDGEKTLYYYTEADKIFLPENSSSLFSYGQLKTIDLKLFDSSNVTDMSSMFENCKNITSLDSIKDWNVSNVTNMKSMFEYCQSLTSLDGIKDWDVSNVVSMCSMFKDCRNLTSLNGIKDWNVSNVTGSSFSYSDTVSSESSGRLNGMNKMFMSCTSLKSLDGISKWDTSKVANMDGMFTNCRSITSLDAISNWNVSNVTNMRCMFESCYGLENVDLSQWNTSNVSNLHNMFAYCHSMKSVNLSNWNIKNVATVSGMFQNGQVGTSYNTTYKDSSLETIDLSGWDTANVVNMSNLFDGCKKLTTIKGISSWNVTKVKGKGHKSDTSHSLYGFTSMFSKCSSLTSLDLSSWDTSNSLDFYRMFSECYNLQVLDLSGWNTSKVTEMSEMFYGDGSLKTILVSDDWNVEAVKHSENMFSQCRSLPNYDWDVIDANKAYAGGDGEGYLTYKLE